MLTEKSFTVQAVSKCSIGGSASSVPFHSVPMFHLMQCERAEFHYTQISSPPGPGEPGPPTQVHSVDFHVQLCSTYDSNISHIIYFYYKPMNLLKYSANQSLHIIGRPVLIFVHGGQ